MSNSTRGSDFATADGLDDYGMSLIHIPLFVDASVPAAPPDIETAIGLLWGAPLVKTIRAMVDRLPGGEEVLRDELRSYLSSECDTKGGSGRLSASSEEGTITTQQSSRYVVTQKPEIQVADVHNSHSQASTAPSTLAPSKPAPSKLWIGSEECDSVSCVG